jgi:hypothetical protein
MTLPNFDGLTFAELPVTTLNTSTGATSLNSSLVTDAAAGATLIAAISDPNSTQRVFNPVAEGNTVQSGDAASKWLPALVAFSAAQVTDNLNGGINDVGQVTIQLKPATANTVEAGSPLTFKVSPQATVTVATGTF